MLLHIVDSAFPLNPASCFPSFLFFFFLSFFFFFFAFTRLRERQMSLFRHYSRTVHHYSSTVHTLKNIKNASHGTIHTFKNYFATVFSVFSFSSNKFNPNGPILLFISPVSILCALQASNCSLVETPSHVGHAL